ncbi:hypothetical protein ABTA52_18545, partial [Acinetobacter baumannii]
RANDAVDWHDLASPYQEFFTDQDGFDRNFFDTFAAFAVSLTRRTIDQRPQVALRACDGNIL